MNRVQAEDRYQDVFAEAVAQCFHESYDYLAPHFGYKTREESAVPWAEVPTDNKRLMVATVKRVLDMMELS